MRQSLGCISSLTPVFSHSVSCLLSVSRIFRTCRSAKALQRGDRGGVFTILIQSTNLLRVSTPQAHGVTASRELDGQRRTPGARAKNASPQRGGRCHRDGLNSPGLGVALNFHVRSTIGLCACLAHALGIHLLKIDGLQDERWESTGRHHVGDTARCERKQSVRTQCV